MDSRFVAGNRARLFESLKNITAGGSLLKGLPLVVRIGLTLAAFWATWKMQGYYGKAGHEELELDKVPETNHGPRTWLDAWAPEQYFTRADGQNNFTGVMSIIASTAAILERSKPIKARKCAQEIIHKTGQVAAWAMTGMETMLAEHTGQATLDAIKGVLAGNGAVNVPEFAGAT